METVDAVVIGAGVMGLAIGRALAMSGRETLILEARPQFGTETSSRNSEVIHAGIYYPRGSLKAKLCVAGRASLYRFCEEYGISHGRCGKLLVATTEEQQPALEAIRTAAQANGVSLNRLSREEALQLEPELACVGALYSPLTGIVDSHSYMATLLGHAESHGATLVCNSKVSELIPARDGMISLAIDAGAPLLGAKLVVNCAGLGAPEVARSIAGFPPDWVPVGYLAKGNYFSLTRPSPFKHLIYPIPAEAGLGIHLTLDLAGRARFGPDVQWIEELNYEVDAGRAAPFYAAIRHYWPGLPDDSLQPAYAGIRPKITGPGDPAADFRIDGPAQHGVPGVINLFGIESPGLTASLALADHVANLAAGG
jgi:L-2-hydroxyglutarate oxidase LhgO